MGLFIRTWLFSMYVKRKIKENVGVTKRTNSYYLHTGFWKDQPWIEYEVSIHGALRGCSALVNREGSCPLLLPR